MDLNFNNTSQTDSGNLIFSGVSSGIDTQGLVDSIIASKRITAVQYEERITLNDSRVSAFDELQTLSRTFAASLDQLRGDRSVFGNDVFNNKLAFTSSRATASAPADHVVSPPANILGVSVSSEAVAGQYTVEVQQIAKAHQVRSGSFSSTSASLDSLGFTTGDFEINGKTVTLSAGDSLLDLRDKINTTNSGVDASGVSASVISVSDTEHYLVLTSSETGAANNIDFGATGQAVHNSLGLTDNGTNNITNEIQTAQDAIIRVNNLGVDITRSSNTISDVIGGVTLDLFDAEPNTEIVVDVEADLASIKTAVVGFVDSYNALKDFILDQKTSQIREGDTEASFGVLSADSTLRQVEAKLNEVLSATVAGLPNGFASLGQVGIDVDQDYKLVIDNDEFDENLLTNLDDIQRLFGLDVSVSDSRVTVISVETTTAYSVDGSGAALPYYLNIGGTNSSGNITSANLSEMAGAGSTNDGTLFIEGNIITATGTSQADGLRMLFVGGADSGPVTDIEVKITRGVADQLHSFFDDLSKAGGDIDNLQDVIAEQNTSLQESVERVDARLEIQRQTLVARFLAMETAIFTANTIQNQVQQQIDALNGGNS